MCKFPEDRILQLVSYPLSSTGLSLVLLRSSSETLRLHLVHWWQSSWASFVSVLPGPLSWGEKPILITQVLVLSWSHIVGDKHRPIRRNWVSPPKTVFLYKSSQSQKWE